MESINKKILAFSLILALFTTFLLYIFIMRNSNTTEVSSINYERVYVATKTMAPGYKIKESDIILKELPKESINKNSISDKSVILEKRVKDQIIEGEQILTDRLSEENGLSLAYKILPGYRAVSINVVEQINVSNLVYPGDFVDVIASFDKEDYDINGVRISLLKVAKIILQNVKVLGIGQDLLIEDSKEREPPKTVTLSVKAEDVEKLVYSSEYGYIRLALRGYDDSASYPSKGIVRTDIVPIANQQSILGGN